MVGQGSGTKIEHGEHVREFGIDRTCRTTGCIVRLSRYNPDRDCGVHAQQRFEMLLPHRRSQPRGANP